MANLAFLIRPNWLPPGVGGMDPRVPEMLLNSLHDTKDINDFCWAFMIVWMTGTPHTHTHTHTHHNIFFFRSPRSWAINGLPRGARARGDSSFNLAIQS